MLINKLRFHREGGCTLQDGDEEWEGEGHCCNQTGSKWWSQRPRSKMDLSSWLVTDLIIWAAEFSELNNGNLVVAIASLAQRWTAYSFLQQFLYVGSQWLHSRATWIPMCVCQFMAIVDGNRMFVSWPSARQISFRVIFWPGHAFLLLRFLDDTQSERTFSTTPYRQIVHCHHVPLWTNPRAVPDSDGSIRQEGSRGHEYWDRGHHKDGIRRIM